MQRNRFELVVALAALAGCAGESPPGEDDTTNPNTTLTATAGDGSGDDTGMNMDDAGITTDDPTAADSTTDEMNCGEENFMLEAVPPNVMLVLDRSGSMADNFWDADDDAATPDISRWNSLYNVVESVVTTFNTDINFGAQYFPSDSAQDAYSAAACTVDSTPEVPVDMMNADAILASLAPADIMDLAGATPATAALDSAIAHLTTLDPNIDRFMVLVTDGAANCSPDADPSTCPSMGCTPLEDYDTTVPTVVGDAFMVEGIPTYVVGIDVDPLAGVQGAGADGVPEADTYVRLNEVAVAGGRALEDTGNCTDDMGMAIGCPRFFNASNEIELQSALDEIAGQVFSCTVPLSNEPAAPEFVEIEVGGMSWEQVADCTTEDGWVYTNPDGPYDAIELCGAACDALATAGTLDVTFGCPPPG